MSPSKLSYVKGFHKLVCKEIGKAVEELKEQGKEAYPPDSITYIMDGEEFALPFNPTIDLPLATLDVMEHNGRHS